MTLDAPALRAERLLRDVLGESQFRQLRSVGYLDIPSRRARGRVYRLDTLGNLSYRDPGEKGFNTTLCVQANEAVPQDDLVVMRYLLATADEERLLETANPITFGFLSLARALHHDFAASHPQWLALLMTTVSISLLLGAFVAEAWVLFWLIRNEPLLGVVLLVVLMVPAAIGGILALAAVAEAGRSVTTWVARRRLKS